jgi:hypothetical protein
VSIVSELELPLGFTMDELYLPTIPHITYLDTGSVFANRLLK